MGFKRGLGKSWLRITRLTGSLISLALVVVCFLENDYNFFTNDQHGYRLLQKKQFDLAAKEFSSLSWKGVALYRDGKFKEAAAAFSGMDSPEGALNHGNSLLMLGKYQEAIERYERALILRPNWPPATINLDLAKNRGKLLEKKGGEMTGGKLAADEYVFSKTSDHNGTDEEVVAGGEASEAEKRAIWLRQVQTKPADFLRTKFAYQYQMNDVSTRRVSENDKEQEIDRE